MLGILESVFATQRESIERYGDRAAAVGRAAGVAAKRAVNASHLDAMLDAFSAPQSLRELAHEFQQRRVGERRKYVAKLMQRHRAGKLPRVPPRPKFKKAVRHDI